MEALRLELERAAAESGIRVGVSVMGLDGEFEGSEVGVNEDEVFQSASLIKILILAELLRQVDEGVVSLDERLPGGSVGRLAGRMISVSDNAAANALIDRLGFESINSLARELGLEQTVLGRRMLDFEARARGKDNYTSASDMVELLSAIQGGELLSPASREFALSALESQQFDSKIPAALPPGTRVLHKTGELEGIEHDAGIVYVSQGDAFATAILTEGDPASSVAAIQRTAAAAHGAFSNR
jgi:beta-lactamase class A